MSFDLDKPVRESLIETMQKVEELEGGGSTETIVVVINSNEECSLTSIEIRALLLENKRVIIDMDPTIAGIDQRIYCEPEWSITQDVDVVSFYLSSVPGFMYSIDNEGYLHL